MYLEDLENLSDGVWKVIKPCLENFSRICLSQVIEISVLHIEWLVQITWGDFWDVTVNHSVIY